MIACNKTGARTVCANVLYFVDIDVKYAYIIEMEAITVYLE